MQQEILTKLTDEDKAKGHILPLLPLPNAKENTFFVIHNWMITHLNLSGNDLFLFGIIFGFCNNTGTVCYCGRDYLASIMNVTNITVTRSVKNLEDRNLIIVDRVQTKDKSNNYYSINVDELIKIIKDKSEDIPKEIEEIKTNSLNNTEVKEVISTNNNDITSNTDIEEVIYDKEEQNYTTKNKNIEDTNNNLLPHQLQNVTRSGNKLLDYNICIYNIDNNIENNKIKNFIVEPEISDIHLTNSETVNLSNTDSVSIDNKTEIDKKTNKNIEFHLGQKKQRKRKTNDKAKMFALIKQLFFNDNIKEPDLVEALTKFLQQRISRSDAIKLTYDVWEKQLQLLIQVSEGDYKYALGLVNDAYNGGYRSVCFSNQQKTKNNRYNKKMSYNLHKDEMTTKIATMSRKEREEYYKNNIALDENGNPMTF